MLDGRFDRQILLFGIEGQTRIESVKIGIVGLGGLGSHVAQQLAYLGTKSFVLIDADMISPSNLNRLIGGTPDDVAEGMLKVDIAARVIQSIAPDANPVVIPHSLMSHQGFSSLEQVDFVLGCVDNDAARLVLNEWCQAYAKPYLDIATDIFPEEQLVFGGRIIYSVNGELCLSCKQKLDQEEIRTAFASDAQLEEDQRIYGVPRTALRGGPSVVSLNGILASVAVTEFMVEVTGIRPAYRSLEYNGMMGRLVIDRDSPVPDCYYCKGIYGQGERTDTSHYIRLDG